MKLMRAMPSSSSGGSVGGGGGGGGGGGETKCDGIGSGEVREKSGSGCPGEDQAS